eukprot:TRINITY_DN67580_c1_g2_i1.p1 TRINITY_DN67580_c1_g2~~TRINITY_DN67580_c1_g2_i1.p1  ORF type:complete len:274 (-),score=166.10 TRINITY_DN67580_c1_g2_i1:334-1050(-)
MRMMLNAQQQQQLQAMNQQNQGGPIMAVRFSPTPGLNGIDPLFQSQLLAHQQQQHNIQMQQMEAMNKQRQQQFGVGGVGGGGGDNMFGTSVNSRDGVIMANVLASATSTSPQQQQQMQQMQHMMNRQQQQQMQQHQQSNPQLPQQQQQQHQQQNLVFQNQLQAAAHMALNPSQGRGPSPFGLRFSPSPMDRSSNTPSQQVFDRIPSDDSRSFSPDAAMIYGQTSSAFDDIPEDFDMFS